MLACIYSICNRSCRDRRLYSSGSQYAGYLGIQVKPHQKSAKTSSPSSTQSCFLPFGLLSALFSPFSLRLLYILWPVYAPTFTPMAVCHFQRIWQPIFNDLCLPRDYNTASIKGRDGGAYGLTAIILHF